jgi:pilus assembly protein Flp/PilA
MSDLRKAVRSFLVEDEGATMVEYGIMIALIAAICVAIIGTLGSQVKAAFQNTSNALPAT